MYIDFLATTKIMNLKKLINNPYKLKECNFLSHFISKTNLRISCFTTTLYNFNPINNLLINWLQTNFKNDGTRRIDFMWYSMFVYNTLNVYNSTYIHTKSITKRNIVHRCLYGIHDILRDMHKKLSSSYDGLRYTIFVFCCPDDIQYRYVYLDFIFHLIANKQINRYNPILLFNLYLSLLW